MTDARRPPLVLSWLDDSTISGYIEPAMRILRHLRDALASYTSPFVWALGFAPRVLVHGITSFCAALFIVFMFGFFALTAHGLLH